MRLLWIFMIVASSLVIGLPIYGLVITAKDGVDPFTESTNILIILPIFPLGAAFLAVIGLILWSVVKESSQNFSSSNRFTADSELREALDDLWGCIGATEIAHLQETTRTLAQQNHELLHHSSTEQGER